jgi:ATP/maltotriose-dependent transcriptional regulator MalT/DNA-binding SARP family transcriptional activator
MNEKKSTQLAQLQTCKLTSPAYLPGKLMLRNTLLEELKHLQAHRKKVILIEARAGSGKSVFAEQYVSDGNRPSGWCQIGLEDHDPVAFLNVLVLLFQEKLPGFHSKNVAKALAEGIIHYREVSHFAALLAQEIGACNNSNFQLVLDDLHLLDGAGDSAILLITLIRKSPSWMQWILVSRYSIKKILNIDHFNLPCLIIDGEELDFSQEETARLLQDVFGITLSFEEVQQIQQQTEGWVTGLTLWAMQSRKTHLPGVNKSSLDISKKLQHHLSEYFQEAILGSSSQAQVEKILQMVLLEDLPVALLERLFTPEGAAVMVMTMTEENRFFRSLDEEGEIYSFHHLFRESLLPLAQNLTDRLRREVIHKAAHYHLEIRDPLRALRYAVHNEDIVLCENILGDYGQELLHCNHIKTLQRILNDFPLRIVTGRPWLSFYYGACMQDSEPAKALSFLTKAQNLFSEARDEIGLLVTNSQLIEYHSIIDGQFNAMKRYVTELEEVYSHRRLDLPLALQLRIAYSLAMGFCFLQIDMKKVQKYDTLVLGLSIQNNLENMTAMARLIRAYRFSFVGNWVGAREELEASLTFIDNPRVAALTRLFLYLLKVNLLELTGDFPNYRAQKQLLTQAGEQDALAQSIIVPLLAILDADMALAEGDIDGVEKCIDRGLQNSYAGSKPHMRSQFFCYKALVFAVRGQKNLALAAIQESLVLRKQAGAMSFMILAYHFSGAAYAQLLMVDEALAHFTRALSLSRNLNEEFTRSGIFAHRAMLYFKAKGEGHALADIRSCLKLMKKNSYRHFFSFMPSIMGPLLRLAIKNNIETDYATWLLAETMCSGVTRDGEVLPFLQVRLLSDWSIISQNGTTVSLQDFNQKEKLLIVALLESPGNCLDRNIISEKLWPETTEKKQRSSFDVLISHLRRKLADLAAPFSAREYLQVEQGSVKLQHCHIDAHRFVDYARKAQKHHENGEMWQAGNIFQLAFSLWGEMGCDGLRLADSTFLADKIENNYITCAKKWAERLQQQGQQEKARQLLHEAFLQRSFDLELARQLYNLHAGNNNQIEAQKVVQLYRRACHDAGIISYETEATAGDFWDG